MKRIIDVQKMQLHNWFIYFLTYEKLFSNDLVTLDIVMKTFEFFIFVHPSLTLRQFFWNFLLFFCIL